MGRPDVAVVGAGIFGVTAALSLRRRGHAVALLDPGPLPHPDAASTDISKLVRLEYGADEQYTELMERALARFRAWNDAWPRPLFHETGLTILSSVPMAAGSFEGDSHETLSRRGHRLDRLDADAIARRFPAWTPGRYVDGFHDPQGGWVESGAVVAALLEQCRAAGVSVRRGERVRGVEATAGGARLTVDSGALEAAVAVVAAGAWTPTLLPWLRGALRSVGQPVLHFQPADPRPWSAPAFLPWAADVARTGWYGFCAHADGRVKIANHGPGVPIDPSGPRPLPADAEPRFREFLRGSLPELADAPIVGRRLCLYCDSHDGDLVIGAGPDPSVVVAAGGSGHAFKLAPLLGDLVADAVEGRSTAVGARFAPRPTSAPGAEAARHVV